MKHKKRVEYIS